MKIILFVIGFYIAISASSQTIDQYIRIIEGQLYRDYLNIGAWSLVEETDNFNYENYSLIFSDEFNTTELDEKKWLKYFPYCGESRYHDPDGNIYLDENVSVSGGYLRLTAKEQSYTFINSNAACDQTPITKSYTSGMIHSHRNLRFKHGYFEIKCKGVSGEGFWPAFWLFGGDERDEIDVFEWKGSDENWYHKAYHWGEDEPNPGNFAWISIIDNYDIYNEFHVYGLEWTEDYLIWYIDNVPILERQMTFETAMHLIINLAISESGKFGGPPNYYTPFPSEFLVDYVRVYKKIDCADIISLPNYRVETFDFVNHNPKYFLGKEINVTGNSVLQSPIHYNKTFMYLHATDKIHITDNFHVMEGATFHAKIIDCPLSKSGTIVNNDNYNEEIEIDKTNAFSLQSNNSIIYPNPNNGYFKLDLTNNVIDFYKIKILNSNGQIISNLGLEKNEIINIDLSRHSKGMYFVKIYSNSEIITRKVIYN